MSSKRDRARSCMRSSFRWLEYYKHARINMALVNVFKSSSNVSSWLAVRAFFLSYCGCSSHGTAERGLCFRAFTISAAHVSRRSGGWQLCCAFSPGRAARGASSSCWSSQMRVYDSQTNCSLESVLYNDSAVLTREGFLMLERPYIIPSKQ